MYLLGIDGGQTSTKACLYDQETGEIQFSVGPPIEHMLTLNGQIRSKHGIQQTLYSLLSQVTLFKRIEMVFLSISGVHKEQGEMLRNWIVECVDFDHFVVEGDVKANLAGASAGRDDGILVVAGGGSIGYYNDGINEFVAGGYGYLLGDEGSAYWIGLQALKAGICDSDGKGSKTLLRSRLLQHFNEDSFWGIKKSIQANEIQNSNIADLSLIVEELAGEGDRVAKKILKQAGQELADIAIAVIKQVASTSTDPATSCNKVYPTGGVFNSKNGVMENFRKTLEDFDSRLVIQSPKYSPLIGTIILASKHLNISISLNDLTDLE